MAGWPLHKVRLISAGCAIVAGTPTASGPAMAAAIGLERECPDRLPISKRMNQLGAGGAQCHGRRLRQ